MDAGWPSDWYLEIEGTETGPHSAAQLRQMFADGAIPASARVCSDLNLGMWIPISELFSQEPTIALFTEDNPKSQVAAPDPAAAHPDRPRPANIPPRPEEISHPHPHPHFDAQDEDKTDPAQYLFEALQAFRDKRVQVKLMTPSDQDWGQLSRPERRVPSQIWLIAALLAVIATSIWGILRIAGKSSTSPPTVASAPAPTPPTRPAGAPLRPNSGKPAPTQAAAPPLSNELLQKTQAEVDRLKRELASERDRQEAHQREQQEREEQARREEAERAAQAHEVRADPAVPESPSFPSEGTPGDPPSPPQPVAPEGGDDAPPQPIEGGVN